MVDTIQRSKAVFCGNTVSITEGRETERGDYALISDAVNAGKTASPFPASCMIPCPYCMPAALCLPSMVADEQFLTFLRA